MDAWHTDTGLQYLGTLLFLVAAAVLQVCCARPTVLSPPQSIAVRPDVFCCPALLPVEANADTQYMLPTDTELHGALLPQAYAQHTPRLHVDMCHAGISDCLPCADLRDSREGTQRWRRHRVAGSTAHWRTVS